MSGDVKKSVKTLAGSIAALGFLVLAYLSMMPEYTLTWPVIAACVLITLALLDKLDPLAEVIESWWGKGGD